jgi:hypothetical protein
MKLKQYFGNFYYIILRDPLRKPFFTILYEIILLLIKDKVFPVHYFSRGLYKKGSTGIFNYVNNKILYSLNNYFNDLSFEYYLDNKFIFHLYFEALHLPLPKLLAFQSKNLFYINSKQKFINTFEEYKQFINELILQVSDSGTVFMKCTRGSYGGKNIFMLKKDDIKNDEKIRNLFELSQNIDFIYEEKLIQHADMNKINPNSINTLRIDTFWPKDGLPEIISTNMRMGLGNSYVDNISSGGCGIGIDKNTGQLFEKASTSISVAGGDYYIQHPLTGLVFKGYTIPCFEEAKQLVLNAAKCLPFFRLIGWDVAITKDGPVLIEGNTDYDITSADKYQQGYRKNPVFQKLLQEYYQLKKSKKSFARM